MRFRDFEHFIAAWMATTRALRTAQDYRELVVDYAARAQAQGAVYLEAIFSPSDKASVGVDQQVVFEGFCDGAQEARETLGIEIRLTPDITRGVSRELANETAELAVRYRDRGVVALGLGGLEAQYPPERYAEAFAIARAGGLASVPHAGEVAGPSSIRGALDALHADRIRHGVRAVEDPGLLRELADRQLVLDVCVLSNVCLSVVPSRRTSCRSCSPPGSRARSTPTTRRSSPATSRPSTPPRARSGPTRARCSRRGSPARCATRRRRTRCGKSPRRMTGRPRPAPRLSGRYRPRGKCRKSRSTLPSTSAARRWCS
jgi:Adenosine deaminase